MRAWGPGTGPTACAPAGRRCGLWGWRKGVPGGGAFHRCEGRLRSGAPPPPTAPPWGGLFGSATHVLWAWVCGCGGPVLSLWLACPVGAACRGGGGGPSPGGVACHRCEGRLVSGAVPPPAARPLGRAAGVPRPACPGCGWCGHEDPAPAPQRAPLRAGVARRGGGGRASPGGGAFRRCEGRLRSGAPPPPTARSPGGAVGVRHPRAVGANPSARPRGQAAGGGTAPDTRRPSQRWQATPPRDGAPPPPRHAGPTGHASQGDSAGPPHPHTRAHSTWVADPDSPPQWGAVGGGGAPDLRRPSRRRKATPPGTPFRQPQSAQRRPARVHAVGPVLGPHARTNRTRDTRVAEPRPPGPEDGRPGEGQRLTPDAPHNGGRPPPPGTAPHHPRGTQAPQGMQAKGTVLGPHTRTPAPTARGWRTPTARPNGGQSGEGGRLTSDAPHNGKRHPPWGTPFRHPHRAQRRPARAHAVGPMPGPHARTNRTRDTRVAEPWRPAPEDGRPGEGQRLTPEAPQNGGTPPPPGTAPHHPCGTQPPQGVQAKGTVLRDPCVPGAVGAGVGTQHRPHSAHPCGPALLAVGLAEGRPRGGCLSPL